MLHLLVNSTLARLVVLLPFVYIVGLLKVMRLAELASVSGQRKLCRLGGITKSSRVVWELWIVG